MDFGPKHTEFRLKPEVSPNPKPQTANGADPSPRLNPTPLARVQGAARNSGGLRFRIWALFASLTYTMTIVYIYAIYECSLAPIHYNITEPRTLNGGA